MFGCMEIFTRRVIGQRAHLIVKNLSEDDRFYKMDPVAQGPFMRFYATVPLQSPAGTVIGEFYMIDDKLRNGVSDADLAFMEEISLIIMTHLEARRVKRQHKERRE